jgi:hypothetical protein
MVGMNESKRTTSRWAKALRWPLAIAGRILGTFLGRELAEGLDLRDLIEALKDLL